MGAEEQLHAYGWELKYAVRALKKKYPDDEEVTNVVAHGGRMVEGIDRTSPIDIIGGRNQLLRSLERVKKKHPNDETVENVEAAANKVITALAELSQKKK